MNEAELEKAHEASHDNKEIIERSSWCGCFHCLNIFPPSEIEEYPGDSALCPCCGMDAVIGNASGFPITPEFVAEMYEEYFSAPRPDNANMPGFNNARAAEISKAIKALAKALDPGCDVSAKIISALHGETFGVVSSRLRIELDFTCFS